LRPSRLGTLRQRLGMIASLLVWTVLTASAVTDQNHGFRFNTNPRRIRCRRNSDPDAFVSCDRGCLHDPQPHITAVTRFPKVEMML
jgi:hypothetical protein